MNTALIAEDEPLLAQHLQAELARLWPGLQVVAQVGDGLSALQQALARAPEVCFLDIRMPGMSGLDAALALAEDWPAGPGAPAFPLLVFVTAYDQYALQAFEAQAVDYLVKPVDSGRLAACVLRLQKRLAAAAAQGLSDGAAEAAPGSPNTGQPHRPDQMDPPDPMAQALAQLRALLQATRAGGAGGAGAGAGAGGAGAAGPAPALLSVIQASVGNLVHMVPVDQVLYFEAADKYVRVVTADGEHLIRQSLRELLPQLDAQQFWQVHRSLVVRATAITLAQREDSGKVTLSLRGRPEKLSASRLYAHLFKGM